MTILIAFIVGFFIGIVAICAYCIAAGNEVIQKYEEEKHWYKDQRP